MSRREVWGPWCVFVIGLACAWPAVRNGWSDYDEVLYCRGNLYQLSLAPEILWKLITTPGPGFQFQPTVYVSHALDYALFGESVHWFHAVNVLLYAWVCLWVARLAQALVGDLDLDPNRRAWAAFLAGGLFALHPVHVEPFAWLGDRKDLLATGFAIWSYVAARRAARRDGVGRVRGWALALGLFTLAMGAKVSVLTLGAVLALDLALVGPTRGSWVRRVGAGVAGAAPLLIAGLALGAGWYGLQAQYPLPLSREAPPMDGWRGLFVLRCFGEYVWLMIWPSELTVHRFPRHTPSVALGYASIFLAACAAWGVVLLRAPRLRAAVLVGGTWFFVGLLPVVNIMWLGAVTERYALFASVGAAIVAGVLAARGLGGPRARLWAVSLVVVAVALGVRTGARIPAWKDSKALWSAVLQVDPEHPFANGQVAALELASGDVDAARERIARALQSAPDSAYLVGVQAAVLRASGDLAGAQALLDSRAGVGDQAGVDVARVNDALGRGDVETARSILERHAETRTPALMNLRGRLRLLEGDPAGALDEFEAALSIAGFAESAYLAGRAARASGDLDRAEAHLALLELGGATWRTLLLRGQLALDRELTGDALAALRDAARARPDESWALSELAIALARAGQAGEAQGVLARAYADGHRDAGLVYNLARLEALAGERAAATRHLREAVAADPALKARARLDPAFSEDR